MHVRKHRHCRHNSVSVCVWFVYLCACSGQIGCRRCSKAKPGEAPLDTRVPRQPAPNKAPSPEVGELRYVAITHTHTHTHTHTQTKDWRAKAHQGSVYTRHHIRAHTHTRVRATWGAHSQCVCLWISLCTHTGTTQRRSTGRRSYCPSSRRTRWQAA